MRRQHGMKPEDVIWIEHYPEAKDRRKESFDLVRFAVVGDTFRTPVWTRITEQAVDELMAGKRNVEDLIPIPSKNLSQGLRAWTLALLSGRRREGRPEHSHVEGCGLRSAERETLMLNAQIEFTIGGAAAAFCAYHIPRVEM